MKLDSFQDDLADEFGYQHNDILNKLDKLEALMAKKIQDSSQIARDNGTISETISNFRDDFNGAVKDLKRQLNYFKAEFHNSSQIARDNEIMQKRIWNRQGGLAVGSGIFFLIVITMAILMYIYKRKQRKLRSNFTSLYKRSFHFLPVSNDLFQNANSVETPNTDETPWKTIDSISI